MKNGKHPENNRHSYRQALSGWGLSVAIVAGLAGMTGFSSVHAQATTGRIHGQAPAGQTVTVQNNTGVHRHTTVGSKGSYSLRMLPLGIYTITLEKDGKPVDTRRHIPLTVGGGAEVDFACPHDQCAAAK